MARATGGIAEKRMVSVGRLEKRPHGGCLPPDITSAEVPKRFGTHLAAWAPVWVALEVDVAAAAELGKTAEELEHIVTRGTKLKTISKKQPKSDVRTPTAAAHALWLWHCWES